MRPAPTREIGAELRALRLRLGLTLAEAAARADVGRTTLMAWEGAKSAPSPDALVRLLDALRTEPRTRAAVLAELAPALAADPVLGPSIGAGEILRAMRVRRSLTQGALAQTMGVSQGAVAKWESGDSVPGGEATERLFAVLGVSPEEAVAVGRTRGSDEPLTIEGARARLLSIIKLDQRSSEPLHLAHWAEVWRRAVRDPRWEPTLVETMGCYVARLDAFGTRAEMMRLAQRTMDLAARSGAWDEASVAFIRWASPMGSGESDDDILARVNRRFEAMLRRVRGGDAKNFIELQFHNLVAKDWFTPGAMVDTLDRLDDSLGAWDSPLRLTSLNRLDVAFQRAIAAVCLGRFDEAARLEAETPWKGQSAEGGVLLVGFVETIHLNRMWQYLDYGVEPTPDDLRRFEAYSAQYETIPVWRNTLRNWDRAYQAKKRRSFG